ncbi:MAG: hypothetical protein F7B59_07820 [Desulfurococcales archaeon]|nr:hypothetical protein [Desulfurococcales archaeon]
MTRLTPKLGMKRFQLGVSIAVAIAFFIILIQGIIVPPQNPVIALLSSIGLAVILYYTQVLVYGVSAIVYLILTLATKVKKTGETTGVFETEYYTIDDEEELASWDMSNTGESFAVIQSIKSLAYNISEKPPYVALLVVSPRGSVIYTENDDLFDEYVSESILEQEEENFERTHLRPEGRMSPGIRIVKETKDSRDGLLVIADKETYERLSKLIMASGETLVIDDLKDLEVIYNLIKELVKTYSESDLSKPLAAYSTVKMLNKLERRGAIEIDSSLKSKLPLEDKSTVVLVNKQIQEEEKLRTDRRNR